MVLALAVLLLIAGGLVLGQMQIRSSLNDFVWMQDAPAAANALPGQGS